MKGVSKVWDREMVIELVAEMIMCGRAREMLEKEGMDRMQPT
jgi:hypothetical protein